MADDNLQSRLQDSLHGAPQTNPDERRQYLGSLRERVALRLTNAELRDPATLPRFTATFGNYADQGLSMLLNGKLPGDTTTPYLTAATKADFPFTLVNDATANLDPAGSGLLLVAKDAINRDNIDLPPVPAKPAEKPGLFDRLFH